MAQRGGAARGREIRVVVWGERATVGRVVGVVVKPLLETILRAWTSGEIGRGTHGRQRIADLLLERGLGYARKGVVGGLLETLSGGKVEGVVGVIIVSVVKTLLRSPGVEGEGRDIGGRGRHVGRKRNGWR